VQVTGLIKAEDIDVGGKIGAGAVSCGKIRVGGQADVKGTLEASSVEVGGKIVAGIVKIGNLNVGGEAEVEGGSITGQVRVGGKFISKTPLEFGELLVYGRGLLPANCKGHRLSTFGKISVAGNITCDQIQVNGLVEILGDCHAERVEVGGKFEVSGSLFAAERLEGFGATTVAGSFEGTNLRVAGKFQANKITVKEEADLSGKVETKLGLKAKLITVRTGSRCEGVLIGERVEVGKSSDVSYNSWSVNWATKWAAAGAIARVDDIYACDVVLGPMCRAARIFAKTVKLEQGSAAEQVSYTNILETDFSAAISEPPKKLENLPPPPF
jgi:cytoskeletal protein CcmA (bactofilin family)